MARTTRLQATRRAAASSGDGGTATASARPGHLPVSLATTIPDNERSLMDLAASAAFEAGNVLYVLGRGAEAEAHWQRAARRNPRHAESRSNIGVAHYSARRFAEAASAFEVAVGVAPGFAESYQNLGAARKALGDADRALEAYRTASHLAPLGHEARRGAALVLRERGRLGEALHWLRSARVLSPSEAQIALDVGIVHVSAPPTLCWPLMAFDCL